MNMMHARRAYQMTRQAMDPREQEADVFRRAPGGPGAAVPE